MKIITKNKRAFFEYHIFETLEAGIVLSGDEVKSIRKNKPSLEDSYVTVHAGNAQLLNCFIAPYSHAFNRTNKEDSSRKSRRLLLNKKEIFQLVGEISRKGYTVIPLKMYFNAKSLVKLEIGLAKHKKLVDKKKTIKERDIQREVSRELKGFK